MALAAYLKLSAVLPSTQAPLSPLPPTSADPTPISSSSCDQMPIEAAHLWHTTPHQLHRQLPSLQNH